MLELYDPLALLTAAQLDRDTTAQSGRRHLPTDHADALGAERREQFGSMIVGNAAKNALAAGMTAIDHRAQFAFVAALFGAEHVVELVDHEGRLPSLDGAIERGFADIDSADSTRHQE